MRSVLAAILAGATLVASPSSVRSPQQTPAGWPAVVDGYRQALSRAGIVGSSLMVVRDGRIVARQNEGEQDRERHRPITDDTIYHWALGACASSTWTRWGRAAARG